MNIWSNHFRYNYDPPEQKSDAKAYIIDAVLRPNSNMVVVLDDDDQMYMLDFEQLNRNQLDLSFPHQRIS